MIEFVNNKLWDFESFSNKLNHSCPGLQELRQTLGGGQICPTIKKFEKMVENHVFQDLP